MEDFDRVFDPHYAAVDLFTDRGAEHAAFAEELLRHAARVREGTAVLAEAARRNVVVFYGIGGIGKTALSRRLERWVLGELTDRGDWEEPPRLESRLRTVRLDFHGSAAVNAADTVLRLRAAVAGAGPRFPAFDLGLAAWWALAHPGTALPDMDNGRGVDVRAQITDTLNDILNDAGARLGIGPLTVRTGMRLVDAVRAKRLRDRTLRDCAPLSAVIDQARLNPTPYVAAALAGLLSWDLERLPPDERPVVVAFADAIEYVQGVERGQERLLNRIVHLTPGILWVAASRSSLVWGSGPLTGLLPAAGPRVWPGLRLDTSDSQQHLVGNLSDTDVDRYLTAASGTAGNPLLPAEVIDRIRHGAHGLPLYLDLSLSIARQSADTPLDAAAFGGPLPELVTRLFADLPGQERDVARAAALLPRFDPALLSRATRTLDGSARRFTSRSLVTEDGHPLFPFRLHDAVRAAIAEEPLFADGAWSAVDRTHRAAALVEALRERHDENLESVEHRLDVVELAVGLCRSHTLEAPWLLEAISDLPGMGRIAERMPPPFDDTWIGLTCTFFQAWQDRSLQQRVAYLQDFTARPLPDDIRRMALRWLAFGHRLAGDTETALGILESLLAETPESELLRYQVARTFRTLGRYDDLTRHLVRYPLGDTTTVERLRSDLAYDCGDIAASVAGPRDRAVLLRASGRHSVALENEVVLLWRNTLLGRAALSDCDASLAEADRYGSPLDLRTVLAAKAVQVAGDEAAFRGVAAESAAVLDASGGAAGWREWSAALVHGLRTGDRRLVEDTHAAWAAMRRPRTPAFLVVDRLCVYAGLPALCPLPTVAESDPEESAARWRAVIEFLVS